MVAAITGAQAVVAMRLSSTFGQCNTFSTGDQLFVQNINRTEGTEELTANPIGSGDLMAADSQRGTINPGISFSRIAGFNDAGVAAMNLFFGTETVGNGNPVYHHSVTFNETLNSKWASFGIHADDTSFFEHPTGAPTKLVINVPEPTNYVTVDMDFITNKEILGPSGATNTWNTINAATTTETERMISTSDAIFLINAQAGAALSTATDVVNIKSATITYERPQKVIHELKNALGNSQPSASGDVVLMATISIVLKDLNGITYFTAHQAGTEYKASLQLLGTVLSGGSNQRTFTMLFPRLKITTSPDYNLSTAGINEQTLTFKALVAASTPSGMFDKYPHLRWINSKSTSHLTVS